MRMLGDIAAAGMAAGLSKRQQKTVIDIDSLAQVQVMAHGITEVRSI